VNEVLDELQATPMMCVQTVTEVLHALGVIRCVGPTKDKDSLEKPVLDTVVINIFRSAQLLCAMPEECHSWKEWQVVEHLRSAHKKAQGRWRSTVVATSVKLKLHHLVGGNSKEHLQEESKEQLQEETSKHLQEKEYAAEVDEALRATEDAWKGLDVEIELTVETAHPALEVSAHGSSMADEDATAAAAAHAWDSRPASRKSCAGAAAASSRRS